MFKRFSSLTLLGLATMAAAYAQSSRPLVAKVPFSFVAQGTQLPAGNYRLTYNCNSHILSIQGLDRSVFVTAAGVDAADGSAGPGRVTFHCYGKSCYMTRVWQGSVGGLQLASPDRERPLKIAARVVSITIPVQ